ncbi:bicoid stability factor isoform X2 [Nomia melanderi]|uniref:bicoid stability factor isoform X2 n=1 Tax=Nomia melanderi TaxID=2448451 RepID=UPI001304140E|nr:leucine-rich PPR motif-containing protein, mitochondrial isoform X2 [Nomia melanderi]
MSILLKYVKYWQFPKNKILNQGKKATNFLVPFENNVLFIKKRNMSAKYTNPQDNFNSLRRIMYQQRWFERDKIETTLYLIVTKDDLNSNDAFLLLQCCNKILDCLPAERLEFGQYVWDYLSTCNVSWTVHHYNELLQLYLNNDKDFSPEDFIAKMLNENIRPNNYTYESCIQYYCEKGNVADAKQLISRQRLYINTEIFKLLMWGHYQNGDLQTALNMFKRKKGIRENNEIYTVLMSIYAAQNDIDRIIETIQICNSKCVNLSNENILNVIYVLAINNYIKDIDKIIFYLNKYKEQLSFNGIQILIKLIYLNHISIITPILSCIKDTLISEILIKHMILSNMNICNIERMCNFLETEKLCSKPLLRALFHSYSKNDENLCFSLLEMCKQHYSVKPHYFWPLLIKKAELYDFQGILNIIKVMINHFEVSPCFDTIYEYVLPFTFECLLTTKNRLITLGVDETILNNALLLNFLEDGKLRMALVHIYLLLQCIDILINICTQ